jgi:tetratricopeptide (TPR) repeat protein
MKTLFFVLGAMVLLSLGGVVSAQVEIECPEPIIENAQSSYYIGLGDVAFARKNYNDAIIAYTCALQLEPDVATTYVARGYAYSELLNIDSALADFERAVELDETLIAAYVNRGAMYTTQGNFGLAINDFTLALALDPNNLEALNNRAVVHGIEGNYDLALADIEQALSIDENYSQSYATRAAIYSAMASQDYQRFVELEGQFARLPAGRPTEVLSDIDDSLKTGNFSIWLALLLPAPR